MKQILFYLLFTGSLLCTVSQGLHSQHRIKVLLYIRDGSGDLDYTLRNEVGVMRQVLLDSGFEAVVATVTGELMLTDSVEIIPDLKLADVDVAEYAGMIIPCMHAGTTEPHPEAVSLVKEILEGHKPVAVQHAAIVILASAGVMQGLKYTFHTQPDTIQYPIFRESTFSGTGVVRDGNIVTSGICPYMGMLLGLDDGTELLTETFVSAIHEKAENR